MKTIPIEMSFYFSGKVIARLEKKKPFYAKIMDAIEICSKKLKSFNSRQFVPILKSLLEESLTDYSVEVKAKGNKVTLTFELKEVEKSEEEIKKTFLDETNYLSDRIVIYKALFLLIFRHIIKEKYPEFPERCLDSKQYLHRAGLIEFDKLGYDLTGRGQLLANKIINFALEHHEITLVELADIFIGNQLEDFIIGVRSEDVERLALIMFNEIN